jgi:hypothetical protein
MMMLILVFPLTSAEAPPPTVGPATSGGGGTLPDWIA